MENDLIKQVRLLKIYLTILTIVLLSGMFFGFTYLSKNAKFKEIDVERINIVEKTGKLRMVISNEELQHPGIVDGKIVPKRSRPPGMIFFNTDGDECGGLIYDGTRNEAGLVLSVDQYRNDQVMQLQYNQENDAGKLVKSYGLKFWDRPDNYTAGQLMAKYDSLKRFKNKKILEASLQNMKKHGLMGYDRMFVGKNRANQVGLFIKDKNGLPRINLYVDDDNRVVMQALDETGHPVSFR